MSIRLGKILVTAAILVFGLQELLNMWRQTGDATSVLVSGLINLVLAGLLLHSALKRPDPLVAPSRGRTIFWNVLGLLCALSLIGNLFGLGKPSAKHRITVNGLTIPLDKCVEGSVRIFKEPAERLAFCRCTATKLAELEGASSVHERALESGRLDEVIAILQHEKKVDMKPFSDCLANSAGSQWTLVMSERFRTGCLARIAADSSYQDLVVSKFCDCLAEKVTHFSPAEVAAWDPDTSAIAIQLRRNVRM